jgi:putative oxidoreductase
MTIIHKISSSDSSKTTLLIRLMVGFVFLSEGIQKFIFPEIRGAGRFESIGLPSPEFLGNMVGFFEITCGLFIILGLLTRLASIPLIVIMLIAFITTKSSVYLEKGFWELLHGSRTDWSMLLGSLFLLIKGSGSYSCDQIINKLK